jgi:SDR family mycofactocin-dependent oxidoreductase
MGTLDGKVAFITGAARGQGRSHALRLAREGADIIALDICCDIDTMDYPNASSADLRATAQQIEKLDRRVLSFETDVRDRAAVKAAVDEGVAQLGRLDIVLANAGIVRLSPASEEEAGRLWDDIVGTNLTGEWNAISASIPHLITGHRGGAIVMTGSTGGVRPSAGTNVGAIAYSAAKAGLIGLCKQLAATYAEHSIRVNIVHPTGVASGMTMNSAMEKLMAEAAAGGGNSISAMQNAMPIAILHPEDITDAVAFLVSDQARWITGASLGVDAGFLVR